MLLRLMGMAAVTAVAAATESIETFWQQQLTDAMLTYLEAVPGSHPKLANPEVNSLKE